MDLAGSAQACHGWSSAGCSCLATIILNASLNTATTRPTRVWTPSFLYKRLSWVRSVLFEIPRSRAMAYSTGVMLMIGEFADPETCEQFAVTSDARGEWLKKLWRP